MIILTYEETLSISGGMLSADAAYNAGENVGEAIVKLATACAIIAAFV